MPSPSGDVRFVVERMTRQVREYRRGKHVGMVSKSAFEHFQAIRALRPLPDNEIGQVFAVKAEAHHKFYSDLRRKGRAKILPWE